MKPVRTLVLVAGEENARLLINDGIGKGLKERAVLSVSQFADAQLEHEDRPGRQTAGPGGMAKHGFDARDSVDELSRTRFAQHVVEAVNDLWKRAKPDRLIVAAPPKMLGVLRAKLSGPPAAALHGDLAKDLLKIAVQDLPDHFADIQPM